MGEFRGTGIEMTGSNSGGDIIMFCPSWHDDNVVSQTVLVFLNKHGGVTILSSKMYDPQAAEKEHEFTSFSFTSEEADLLIEALQTAKHDMAK